MIAIRDFLERDINFVDIPERVISLVPSITHTLFKIGCGEKVIGRTDFCKSPENVKKIKSVGTPKKIDIDKIISLTPDLIIADKDENSKKDIESLIENGFKVYISYIKNVEDIITFLMHLEKIFKIEKPLQIIENIKKELKKGNPSKKITTFLPIWRNPYMSFNEDTFSNDLLSKCGFENVFKKNKKRYFKLYEEDILKKDFELLLLPSEPYNFHEVEPLEIIEDLKLDSNVKIAYIPGEWIAWYGGITPESIKELNKLYRDFFKKSGKI